VTGVQTCALPISDISEKSARKKKPAFVFAKEWNGDIRYIEIIVPDF
jgi:hypothetical protein